MQNSDQQIIDRQTLTVSLIVPVFNEALVLRELIQRIEKICVDCPNIFEIIFVDDGSSDRTVEILIEAGRQNSKIQIVCLTRNFGHQYAISAGLDIIQGELVAIMDADLQDPPELLPQMIKVLEGGYDVVYAVRNSRQENAIKSALYKGFYRILAWLSDWNIPLDAGDFCVMRKCIVEEMKRLPEKNRFIRGIRAWVGYRQTGFPYDRPARFADKSKYSLSKLCQLALDGLFAFSLKPLRVVVIAGICFAMVSFSLALVIAYRRIVFGLNPPGFATLAVITLFMGGVQLVSLGLLGEYIGRIYQEVKLRPLYLIKQIIKPHDLDV